MIATFKPPQNTQIVMEKKAIELLHQTKFRELLAFFMAQPATVGQAASALARDPKRTYNEVQTLVQHGLMLTDRLEARAGRAMRWYRASSHDYFVPFAASGFSDYSELITSQTKNLHQVVADELEQFLQSHDPKQFGKRFFKDPDGKTHFILTVKDDWQNHSVLSQLLHPDAPALLHVLGELELSPDQAKALQLELAKLWSRYHFLALEQPSPTSQRFVLGISLAPYSSTTR
jgi:predicted transcriptional regulator